MSRDASKRKGRGSMADRRALQDAFAALDADPNLQKLAFDGWRAWAIVKPRLWYIALARSQGSDPVRPGAGEAFARVAAGLSQVMLNTVWPARAPLALYYAERSVRMPDGTGIHPHLGSLADPGVAALRGVSAWTGVGGARLRRGWLSAPAVVGLAGAHAPLLMRNAAVRSASAGLASAIGSTIPGIGGGEIERAAAAHLARFRARRAIWRPLLRRSGARALVLTDADSKAAEVAAAKELGLPVVEIQHGVISTREPDFAWRDAHRQAPALPVPDHIVLFGSMWRDALAERGYWQPDALHLAAAPALAPYRRLAAKRGSRRGEPLTVLFPTEAFLRGPAIRFWEAVLQHAARTNATHWRLRIKLHPGERPAAAEYEALAARYPHLCTFVAADAEGFDELAAADLVAGYTSTMLMEALALGVPTVALAGGSVPEGFAATFGFARLADRLPPASEPGDLLDLLEQARDQARYRRWRERALATADAIFSAEGDDVADVVRRIATSV